MVYSKKRRIFAKHQYWVVTLHLYNVNYNALCVIRNVHRLFARTPNVFHLFPPDAKVITKLMLYGLGQTNPPHSRYV